MSLRSPSFSKKRSSSRFSATACGSNAGTPVAPPPPPGVLGGSLPGVAGSRLSFGGKAKQVVR